jgi:hypothetical protein
MIIFGEFLNGVIQGRGLAIFKEGNANVYIGDFDQDNQLTGRGILEYYTLNSVYVGEVKQGMRHGQGEYYNKADLNHLWGVPVPKVGITNPNEDNLNTERLNTARHASKLNTKVRGVWHEDNKEGKFDDISLIDGSVLTSVFYHNDKVCERQSLEFEGGFYQGQVVNFSPFGDGEFKKYREGTGDLIEKYNGEWHMGKYHGQGKHWLAGEKKGHFVGKFVNGVMHCKEGGTFVSNDQLATYKGGWVNGKYEGMGVA